MQINDHTEAFPHSLAVRKIILNEILSPLLVNRLQGYCMVLIISLFAESHEDVGFSWPARRSTLFNGKTCCVNIVVVMAAVFYSLYYRMAIPCLLSLLTVLVFCSSLNTAARGWEIENLQVYVMRMSRMIKLRFALLRLLIIILHLISRQFKNHYHEEH